MATMSENLLINLELESRGFSTDFDKVKKSIEGGDAQSRKLKKALTDLEKSFASVQGEIKAVDRELTTNQKLVAGTTAAYKESIKSIGAAASAYQTLAASVTSVRQAFTDLVSSATDIFTIFNQLTDPQFLMRLAQFALLLSTAARVKGFDAAAKSLREFALTLQKGSVFFSRFREEGDLTLSTLADRAELLQEIQDGMKFTGAAIGWLTLLGVLTGVNDVLYEFGVVNRTISTSLKKMPELVQTLVSPIHSFSTALRQVVDAARNTADAFLAVAARGKTMRAFLEELPGTMELLRETSDSLMSALDDVSAAGEQLFNRLASRLRPVTDFFKLLRLVARDGAEAYRKEIYQLVTFTEAPFAKIQKIKQPLGQRLARAIEAMTEGEAGKTLRAVPEIFSNIIGDAMTRAVGRIVVGLRDVSDNSSYFLGRLVKQFKNIEEIKAIRTVVASTFGGLSQEFRNVAVDLQAAGKYLVLIPKTFAEVFTQGMDAIASILRVSVSEIIVVLRDFSGRQMDLFVSAGDAAVRVFTRVAAITKEYVSQTVGIRRAEKIVAFLRQGYESLSLIVRDLGVSLRAAAQLTGMFTRSLLLSTGAWGVLSGSLRAGLKILSMHHLQIVFIQRSYVTLAKTLSMIAKGALPDMVQALRGALDKFVGTGKALAPILKRTAAYEAALANLKGALKNAGIATQVLLAQAINLWSGFSKLLLQWEMLKGALAGGSAGLRDAASKGFKPLLIVTRELGAGFKMLAGDFLALGKLFAMVVSGSIVNTLGHFKNTFVATLLGAQLITKAFAAELGFLGKVAKTSFANSLVLGVRSLFIFRGVLVDLKNIGGIAFATMGEAVEDFLGQLNNIFESAFVRGDLRTIIEDTMKAMRVSFQQTGKLIARVFEETVRSLSKSLGDVTVAILQKFPIIVKTAERAVAMGRPFVALGAEVVRTSGNILREMQYVAQLSLVVFDAIRIGMVQAFSSGSFKEFSKTLEITFSQAFRVAKGVAGLGMQLIGDEITAGGARMLPTLKGIGDAITGTMRAGVEAALSTDFAGALRSGLEGTTRAIRAFREGFITGFVTPLQAGANLAKGFGIAMRSATPSLVALAEAGHFAGPILLAVGAQAVTSDDKLVQLAGTVTLVAGTIMVGLTAAMSFFLSIAGSFLIMVGDKMIAAMEAFEQKFQKAQVVTAAFAYTLNNFSKSLGATAVGTLETWGRVVESMVAGTQFSITEVQKGVQLLVAESQVAGLSLEQSEKLLARAADLAAAKGLELTVVVDQLIGGIIGNAQAVRALGINVGEHAVEHSKFAAALAEQGVEVSETTKNLIRYNETLAQSAPFAGFAKAALDTIAGATAQYDKALERVQITLGAQNTATVTYLRTLTNLAELALSLPGPLLDAAGVLLDFGGVFLKITGVVLTYTLVLSSLVTVYGLLNKAIVGSVFLQGQLTAASAFAGTAVGVQTVAVTSLNAAFVNLSRIMLGGVLKAFKSMGAAALGMAKSFAIMTGKILMNPLFWKAAIVAGMVLALVKAYGDLRKELKQLQPALDGSGASASKVRDIFTDIQHVLMSIVKSFTSLAKLVIVGLFQIVRLLEVAAIGFQMLYARMTGNEEAAARLGAQFGTVLEEIEELGGASDAALAGVLGAFDQTAVAAEGVAEKVAMATDKVRGFSDALKKVSFDPEKLKLKVMGDEFDRTKEAFLEANEALNRARNLGIEKDGKLELATQKEIAELMEQREEKRFELLKLRQDTLLDLGKLESDLNIKALESAGETVEAVKRRGAIELKEFQERAAALGKISELTEQELAQISRVESAIRRATRAEIERAEYEELSRRLKESEELADKLARQAELVRNLGKELRGVRRDSLQGSDQIIAAGELELETKVEELKILEKQLLAQEAFVTRAGQLRAEYAAILETARDVAKQKLVDLIDSQSFSKQLLDAINAIEPQSIGGKIAKGFLSGMVVASRWLSDTFEKVDFSKMFSGAGDGLASLLEGAKNFDLGASLTSAKAGLEKMFSTEGFKKFAVSFASTASELFVMGVDAIGALFDPEAIGKVADFFGDFLLKLPNELGKAFNKLDGALKKFLEGFPDMLSRILEALPGLIQRVLDKLPQIIVALLNGIGSLLDKLPFIVGRILESLPGLIATLLEKLPTIILKLFNAVGLIVAQVIKVIPSIMVEVLAGLPDIIMAVIEGMIASMGDIVTAFVDFFIGGGLEKIVAALIRAMPRIALALVQGFVRGISRALGSIFGGIRMPEELTELPNKFGEGINNLAKKTTEEASKLFKVLDLEAAGRGLNAAKGIEDVLNRGIARFVFEFKGIFAGLLAAWRTVIGWLQAFFGGLLSYVVTAFQWVVDHILTPLAGIVSTAFNWVVENVINPFINGVTVVWMWFKTEILDKFAPQLQVVFGVLKAIGDGMAAALQKVFDSLAAVVKSFVAPLQKVFDTLKDVAEGFGPGLQKTFEWFKTNILDKFASGIKTVFDTIKTNIIDPIKDLGADIGKNAWAALKTGLGTVGTIINDAVEKLNPANFLSKMFKFDGGGMGGVENALTKIAGETLDVPWTAFARGGLVPGVAPVAGDSAINDRILALLSPGEAVIPRSLMGDPNVKAIVDAVLQGKLLPRMLAFGSGGDWNPIDDGGGPSVPTKPPSLPKPPSIPGVLDNLDPAKMWATFKEKALTSLWDMLQNTSFHTGGLVGFANGGEVPAMLQSGEFVINRQAVQSLGLGTLGALNKGALPGNQEFNFDIELNIKSDGLPDESFIRQRLIPTVKKELKDASLRGEFVMSSKGIRST